MSQKRYTPELQQRIQDSCSAFMEPVASRTPTLPLHWIEVGDRTRKDPGDIDALAASIAAVGLLNPITVVKQKGTGTGYRLIAGARRFLAVQKLGWEAIAVHVAEDLKNALAYLRAEHDENECRKPFTRSEAVALGRELEKLEQQEARKRQAGAGPKEGRGKKSSGSGKLPEPDKGDTRDKVAQAVGMSGKTYEKAKAVVEAAEEEPEKHAATVAEMDRTGKVDQAYRKVKETRGESPKPPVKIEIPGEQFEDTLRHVIQFVSQQKGGGCSEGLPPVSPYSTCRASKRRAR